MGVKCLLHWQPAPGELLTQQTYDDVGKTIESLAAPRGHKWSISCGLYRPQLKEIPASVLLEPGPGPSKELFSVSLASDAPLRQFLVMRHEHLVVEAAQGVGAVLDKLQLYRHRVSMAFEGSEYAVGEFLIRAGRATSSINEVLRGIVVEIEFVPTESIEKSRDALRAFVRMWQDTVARLSLRGTFVLLEPLYQTFGLSEAYYSLQHTALQYVLVTAHFMAAKQ